MTPFWSGWIMSLVTFNLGVTLFLFLWGLRVKIPTLPDGTTGHIWAHGVLRESVRPLPLWWVVISAAMFVIGIGYLVLFPGFGSHQGLLGWTAHGELAADEAATRARLAPLVERHGQMTVEQLADDPVSVAIGQRLFVDNCAACHGASGKGSRLLGAPDLTDRDSLHGGDGEALMTSILDGRRGAMPASGALLGSAGVEQVAQYVLSLSGRSNDPLKAALGKEHFTTCVACHGPDGKGNQALGAPDLTDSVWLYGGSQVQVEKSIRDGRSGEMPAFRGRLSETEAKVIAAWVYRQSNPAGTAR
ncbi:MAG: cytochrome-c oxidase, cbb3-type subunit III [Burkholderiaceae bacterium]|jgi:cytochrome c oxidase cbb3-type subunit 3|nr:cytochrome-c oxidase, cbb3-type subunit III [Burkholderiaceae bacterium]MEB2318288.1 cytochrome-c oxidase, cbb3-type subunit III [Pseudomonadota bacterium]